MPDISLFEPQVLRGVVEKLTTPQNLVLLNEVPQDSHPFPTISWDVIEGQRNIAQPNVPNSEENVVARQSRRTVSTGFIYLREKKVFEPTTLHWVREPGELARTNAEKAVVREIADLNVRFDVFAEWALWRALEGQITTTTPDGYEVDIDYGMAATHQPSAGTAWATATPAQIVDDIRTWKRVIQADAGVKANRAYANETTVSKIFDSFAATGVATTFMGGTLLSDRMKDEFYATGMLPGFMGLDWQTVEQVYTPVTGGSETSFVPDDSVFIGDFTTNRPIELVNGPAADDEAPSGFTGKFAKTWKEKDPSARQYLIEWNLVPRVTNSDNWVVADVS